MSNETPKMVFFRPEALPSDSVEIPLKLTGMGRRFVYKGVLEKEGSSAVFFVKHFSASGPEDRLLRWQMELKARDLCSPYLCCCLGSAVSHEHEFLDDKFLVYPFYDLALPALVQKLEAEGCEANKRNVILWMLLRDILYGLKEIDRGGLVNRDIKPDNVLVEIIKDEDGIPRYRAKIADFDICVEQNETELKYPAGTRYWALPLSQKQIDGVNAARMCSSLPILLDLCSVANVILWLFSDDARQGKTVLSGRFDQDGDPIPDTTSIIYKRQTLLESCSEEIVALDPDDIVRVLEEKLKGLGSGTPQELIHFCACIYADTFLHLEGREWKGSLDTYINQFQSMMPAAHVDALPGDCLPRRASGAKVCHCVLKMDQDSMLCEVPTDGILTLPVSSTLNQSEEKIFGDSKLGWQTKTYLLHHRGSPMLPRVSLQWENGQLTCQLFLPFFYNINSGTNNLIKKKPEDCKVSYSGNRDHQGVPRAMRLSFPAGSNPIVFQEAITSASARYAYPRSFRVNIAGNGNQAEAIRRLPPGRPERPEKLLEEHNRKCLQSAEITEMTLESSDLLVIFELPSIEERQDVSFRQYIDGVKKAVSDCAGMFYRSVCWHFVAIGSNSAYYFCCPADELRVRRKLSRKDRVDQMREIIGNFYQKCLSRNAAQLHSIRLHSEHLSSCVFCYRQLPDKLRNEGIRTKLYGAEQVQAFVHRSENIDQMWNSVLPLALPNAPCVISKTTDYKDLAPKMRLYDFISWCSVNGRKGRRWR